MHHLYIERLIDWLIDWIVFYAVLAIFQAHNSCSRLKDFFSFQCVGRFAFLVKVWPALTPPTTQMEAQPLIMSLSGTKMVTWKGMTAEQMTPSGKLNCVFQKVFFSAISFFNLKNVHVYMQVHWWRKSHFLNILFIIKINWWKKWQEFPCLEWSVDGKTGFEKWV